MKSTANSGQQQLADQQLQILASLRHQKQRLKAGLVSSSNYLPPPVKSDHPPLLPNGQRSALEAAKRTSLGFFVSTDSAFGNVILPVIPRHPRKEYVK